MGALRQSRSFDNEMNGSNGQSPSTGYPSGVYVPSMNQGLPTLIVMVVVLAIIVLFCFWGAPAVRAFCKRKICRCCPMEDIPPDSGSTAEGSATPTIILLPYGRMLVVDRNVFTQLQADHTGIDFMELSANLIRAQRLQTGSNPSFLESDATSKGISPTSMDFLPPAYEDIFGRKTSDLPPSYSEISMMFKNMSCKNSENGSVSNTSERSARILIRESMKSYVKDNHSLSDIINATGSRKNAKDLVQHNSCSFSTPNLCNISSNVPQVKNDRKFHFNNQLKQLKHCFSSLENNNIEKNEFRYHSYRQISNKDSNNTQQNDTNENVCSGSSNHNAIIDKRLFSGPNQQNWNSSLDKDRPNIRYSTQPSINVPFLPSSFSKNQIKLSDTNEHEHEYIDRESSV